MRKLSVLYAVVALLFFLTLPCHATDFSGEFEAYRSGIPEEITKDLPQGLLSENPEESGEALRQALSVKQVFSQIKNALSSSLPSAKKLLLQNLALLLGIALFRLLSENFGGESTGDGATFCTNAMLLLSVLTPQLTAARATGEFLKKLCTLVNSMIPMVGVLLASGGNVTAAVSETSMLGILIIFCENFCYMTLIPVLSGCAAFAAASAFSERTGLDGVARGIKKTFTFLLGLMALIISAVMSGQTLLCAKADSLTARTAKFAAGTFIPVVGGTVGEALRTVAAGVEYLRSSVGIGAIVIICIMLLPTLLSLVLGRISLSICSSCASFLGLSKEASILNDSTGFYGYLMAVCSICSVLAIYALVLFVRISAAA
ncbi:MAG: hypothetical protein J6B55_02525 [Clostridia bacterium]|nr:hypothetical protein [Clostridia bacterium]